MLRIESTVNCNIFKSKSTTSSCKSLQDNHRGGNNILLITLSALALGSIAVFGLKSNSKIISYEKALEKSGVKIQDGIATLTKSGEKFTGKIQRYKTKELKETVNFENGQLIEKLYHNTNNSEMDGYFYKNGQLVLSVSPSTDGERKLFCFRKYSDGNMVMRGDASIEKDFSVFEWARNTLKS